MTSGSWCRAPVCIGSLSMRWNLDLATSGTQDPVLIRAVLENGSLGLRRLLLGTDGNGESSLRLARAILGKLRAPGLSEAELDAIGHHSGLAVLGETAAPAGQVCPG